MGSDRQTAVGLSYNAMKAVERVSTPNAGISNLGMDLYSIGVEMVQREAAEGRIEGSRFHVVSSVYDFDTISAGVRAGLEEVGDVSFSCIWTNYELLSIEPLIEVCPIYKAYHDPEPKDYTIVFVASAIGSVCEMSAMILHTMSDRRYSNGRVWILAPFVHEGAKAELERETYRSKAAQWSTVVVEPTLNDARQLPVVGENLTFFARFQYRAEGAQTLPKQVRDRIAERREIRRLELKR
ncbi:hypothetical protein HFO38_24290 [Rhizobium leguminosarum]|uniref:hypothetical protein n=1 Tax=Rhizobium leguminosarum TaxID=384 RepID=UPI001C97EA85|nr:hypothetical protein [Rhizobium leguminosarum]MBY5705797.1 hypothetical protein [Rhizobium leguminosarum]